MNFSVVIPTLNEEKYIGTLLNSLFKQTIKPKEILVVDGGSVDQTCQFIKDNYPSVKVIKGKKPVGCQRHLGGEKARNEWILFMDADTLVEKDFISGVTKIIKTNKFDIACFWYESSSDQKVIKNFYKVFNHLFYMTQEKVASGAGMCIMVNKNHFKSIGGFKPLVFDDLEFIRRGAKFGKFKFFKEPKVYVSDRRFKKYGVFRTICKHILMAGLFIFGVYDLKTARFYPFGEY